MVVAGLNADFHFPFTPSGLLRRLAEALRLELSLLVEIVLGPRVHKNVQGPLGDLGGAEEMGGVVRQPLARGARASLVVEVVREGVDAPWCAGWVAVGQRGLGSKTGTRSPGWGEGRGGLVLVRVLQVQREGAVSCCQRRLSEPSGTAHRPWSARRWTRGRSPVHQPSSLHLTSLEDAPDPSQPPSARPESPPPQGRTCCSASSTCPP